MNTAPSDTAKTTAIAATEQTKAAAAPRITLSSHGFSIDHPDPELGEQLMANALGVTDCEAMDGILRQLVRASVSGGSHDEVNLSFMISMVKSLKPRDSVEAMLVAQMVSVHVMAMRCAHHLANAEDIARHDSAARALGRLTRTFPAQIEALNRYRSHGEPAITPRRARRRRHRAPGAGTTPQPPSWKQSHERSPPQHRGDAGEPALWRPNPLRRRLPLSGGARQAALPHARRRTGIRRAKGKPERAQARPVHQGCDRRA
jgi:hypothetical protein